MKTIVAYSTFLICACGAPRSDLAAPILDATASSPPIFSLEFAPGNVSPGDEGVHCLDVAGPDEDVWASGWHVKKLGAHHVNLWIRKEPSVTAPWTTVTACGGGWGRGLFLLDSSEPVLDEKLPAGVAMKIPGGSSLIWDVHYLNTSAAPVAEDIAIDFADGTDHVTEASGMVWLNSTTPLDLSPGATKTVTFSPVLPLHADNVLVSLIGHMHAHGVSETATVDGTEVYRSDSWTDPPILHPMTRVGDDAKISWSCTISNDTTATLQWGATVQTSEMCDIFGMATGPHWESEARQ